MTPQSFLQWELGERGFDVADEVSIVSGLNQRIESCLDCAEPQSLPPFDGGARELPVGELAKRLAEP